MNALTTLVLGIGNTLLTDEGVGVHVINRLQQKYADLAHVTFLDGGTLGFSLAGELARHDCLIVVDAARIEAPPGSIICLQGAEMDKYMKGNRKSVHEVGLGDLLDIARLEGHYPKRRALVGIEPFSLAWGETLSPVVESSVPSAMDAVMQLIQQWHAAPLLHD